MIKQVRKKPNKIILATCAVVCRLQSLAGSPGGGSGLLMFGIILAGAYVAVARKLWDNFRYSRGERLRDQHDVSSAEF